MGILPFHYQYFLGVFGGRLYVLLFFYYSRGSVIYRSYVRKYSRVEKRVSIYARLLVFFMVLRDPLATNGAFLWSILESYFSYVFFRGCFWVLWLVYRVLCVLYNLVP